MNCNMYYVFINSLVIRHMTSSLFAFLQVNLFPSMWVYGHHFFTKYVDDGHFTQDCRVEIEFDQSSHDIHHDQNLIEGKLGYIGRSKRSCKWTSHHFNVLFTVASGGIPSNEEM
jgi:hypothetical protein